MTVIATYKVAPFKNTETGIFEGYRIVDIKTARTKSPIVLLNFPVALFGGSRKKARTAAESYIGSFNKIAAARNE